MDDSEENWTLMKSMVDDISSRYTNLLFLAVSQQCCMSEIIQYLKMSQMFSLKKSPELSAKQCQ